jgi:hypothetical protein
LFGKKGYVCPRASATWGTTSTGIENPSFLSIHFINYIYSDRKRSAGRGFLSHVVFFFFFFGHASRGNPRKNKKKKKKKKSEQFAAVCLSAFWNPATRPSGHAMALLVVAWEYEFYI